MTRTLKPSHVKAWSLLATVFLVCGCTEETRVISSRGPLLGLPDADRGGALTRDGAPLSGGEGLNGLETVPESELIRTTPTGERFIISQSPRHVVLLMRRLLSSPDPADKVLLYNQLIADDTKKRAMMEGNEPTRVLEHLVDNQSDILAMLNAMPMGELSPSVVHQRIDDGSGKRRELLRLRDSAARQLEFTELFVQREPSGQYRFLWVK